ncbi:hypothetical protein H6P81_007962 [Aristolochia fimbriata]|uniref:RNase H type-1 domain-containing protein n=1 Tax=Aristolochia fimbriata TaxID=158543 RepID=A0AAV7F677_ARIFI|nr:hypothetical protein H6P81_007962 [Aristolochia fimbriata]
MGTPGPAGFGGVFRDSEEILTLSSFVSEWSCIPRSANTVADTLAKQGVTLTYMEEIHGVSRVDRQQMGSGLYFPKKPVWSPGSALHEE